MTILPFPKPNPVTATVPVSGLSPLPATAPDLMLTLMSRLVTGAFDHLDWVTRALVSPS